VSDAREAGRSIRQRIQEEVKRQQRPARYAVITRANPRTAELTEGGLILDEDDLVLGQWVEQYRKQYGLRVGDTLIVHRMHNGDWLASEVVSDREVRRLKATPTKGPGSGGPGAGEEGGEGGEGEEAEPPEEGGEDLEDVIEAEEVEASKGFAYHGIDPSAARPNCGSCEWHGTVEPLNGIDHDTWINPPS